MRDENDPTGDIEISFVGLRPGEKLYEELFVGDEAAETAHPRIKMARERSLTLAEMERHLIELEAAIAVCDGYAVRNKLNELTELDRCIAAAARGDDRQDQAKTLGLTG